MKKFLKPLKEWTVVRIERANGDTSFQAFNTLTGEYKAERNSHREAEKDIPGSKYAEPWGV